MIIKDQTMDLKSNIESGLNSLGCRLSEPLDDCDSIDTELDVSPQKY